MPPVRTNTRSVSPTEVSSASLAYASNFEFGPTSNINSHPSLYTSQQASSAPPQKKKRSHGKARPPGYIPRPPNAFIIFRTEYIKSMATHSTPEMSKNLGSQWKKMTALEKLPWEDKAREAAEEHKKMYPHYRYKPVHPRDAQGRCIRKPRKPNQPRVKASLLPASYSWMERKSTADFPSSSLPSSSSSASSPPHSPSPAPVAAFSQPSYQMYRRSSSVPLPTGDPGFFQGLIPQSGDAAYLLSPSGMHARRRPSTSMDFACAGPSEPYTYNNAYLNIHGDFSQWRPVHRRSLSAPMFIGETPTAHPPIQEYPHVANPLTPINPEFSNVFDKFSWNATSNAQYPTIVPPMHPYAGLEIPQMTNSPLSNGSATPPAATPDISPSSLSQAPVIRHPAPVSTFDFSAFQAQMVEFDAPPHADSAFTPGAFQDALGFVPPPYQHGQLYTHETAQAHTSDQQFYSVEQLQTVQHAEESLVSTPQSAYSSAADMNGYEEGMGYTQPTRSLEFNELIVEGY